MSASFAPRPQSSSEEEKNAVIHLARGLKLAEMEASEWRQRAIDMEDANEREREQARQLMEFELSAAIREADRERSKLVNQLHDQEPGCEEHADSPQSCGTWEDGGAHHTLLCLHCTLLTTSCNCANTHPHAQERSTPNVKDREPRKPKHQRLTERQTEVRKETQTGRD